MMEDNKEDKSKLEVEEDKSKQELKEDQPYLPAYDACNQDVTTKDFA